MGGGRVEMLQFIRRSVSSYKHRNMRKNVAYFYCIDLWERSDGSAWLYMHLICLFCCCHLMRPADLMCGIAKTHIILLSIAGFIKRRLLTIRRYRTAWVLQNFKYESFEMMWGGGGGANVESNLKLAGVFCALSWSEFRIPWPRSGPVTPRMPLKRSRTIVRWYVPWTMQTQGIVYLILFHILIAFLSPFDTFRRFVRSINSPSVGSNNEWWWLLELEGQKLHFGLHWDSRSSL